MSASTYHVGDILWIKRWWYSEDGLGEPTYKSGLAVLVNILGDRWGMVCEVTSRSGRGTLDGLPEYKKSLYLQLVHGSEAKENQLRVQHPLTWNSWVKLEDGLRRVDLQSNYVSMALEPNCLMGNALLTLRFAISQRVVGLKLKAMEKKEVKKSTEMDQDGDKRQKDQKEHDEKNNQKKNSTRQNKK